MPARSIPTYPFERKRHWVEACRPAGPASAAKSEAGRSNGDANGLPARDAGVALVDYLAAMTNGASVTERLGEPSSELEALIEGQLQIMAKQIEVLRGVASIPAAPDQNGGSGHEREIGALSADRGEVKGVLNNLSGRDLDGIDTSATFFDLGFDSLLLTQASQSLRAEIWREDFVSATSGRPGQHRAVSAYLDEKIPADKFSAHRLLQPTQRHRLRTPLPPGWRHRLRDRWLRYPALPVQRRFPGLGEVRLNGW